MARQYRTGLIITGDASGGIKAIQATEKELDQLNQGFDRGGKRAKRFGQDADRAGRQLGSVTDAAGDTSRELDVLRGAAVSVGAALAGAFAASNLAGQAQMIADTNALAKSINASTTELQAWQYAGEQVGIQGDKMGDIFKDTTEKIGEFARNGGGEAADLIEQMGLNIEELLRLSPDQQLLKIGASLQELTPSGRTSFLESLADDAVRLQPLLENNSAALREYIDEARALGVAMDQVDIDNAVQAAESMDRLQGVAQGLANTLIADLGPGLADTTSSITDFLREAGGAEELLGQLVNVGGTLATLYGARLVGAIGQKTAATVQDTAASLTAARADAQASQATATRAAEALRVAQAEQAAAQRALANARATAAATGSTANRSKALAQLAAANQRVAQAEAVSTAAMNTHTAAMQRASVASRALAGASRAASGALALVGGPLGLLVGAGGLLYVFREELGLTQHRIGLTEGELESFRAELDEMSGQDLGQSLDSLNASLEEATLKAAAAREELAKLRAEDDGYSVTGVGNLSDQVAGINALAEAQEKLRGIEQKRNESRIELWGRWSDAVVSGTAATDASSDANEHNTATIVSQAKAAEELTKQLDRQAESAQGLLDELYPLQASQRQYAEDKAQLVQYALRENKSNEWLEETLRRLQNQYRNAGSAAEEYGLDGTRAADDVETAFDASLTTMERGVERLDDAFVDQWRGMLDGSRSAMDSLEDILLDSMAQIAHNLTTRQLIVPIQAMITGEGQAGGGLFGGGGQGGGFDTSTLIKGGKWGYDQLFGGASAGASGTAAVGYGGSGWASSVGTNTYGGWAGNASGAASASGGSLAGSAASGLYTAGAGMAGSWAGSQVGGAVSDKTANSNVGATAGTAIGAYVGSIFPVVGTYLGAAIGGFLGGVGDTLFGSDKSPPEFEYEQRNVDPEDYEFGGRETPFSSTGTFGFDISRLDDDAQEQLDEFALGLQRADMALAGFMDDGQIDRVKQAMDEFAYAGLSSADLLADRLDVILTGADMHGELYDRMREQYRGAEHSAERYEVAINIASLEAAMERVPDNVLAHVERELDRFEDEAIGDLSGKLITQINHWQQLGGTLETLVPTYDRLAGGAVDTINALVDEAGGVEQLAATQEAYYQAAFSGSERLTHATRSLNGQFEALGIEMPNSIATLRDLVEAQSVNTEEGRRLQLQLMQLAPSIADTAGAVSDAISQQYEAALGRAPDAAGLNYWIDQIQSGSVSLDEALERISLSVEAASGAAKGFPGVLLPSSAVDSVSGALSTYQQVMSTADDVASQRQDQLEDERRAIESLRGLLNNLAIGDASALSSGGQLSAARGRWADLVARAGQGDTDAISEMSSASRDYLDLAQGNASTALEYARIYGQVTGDIAGLEDEYGESSHQLRTIERIGSDQLAMQERARETLIDQLSTQIGMLDGIHTFSGLLESLPAGIADRLEGIISAPSDTGNGDVLPDGEYVDDSGLSPAGKAINDIYNEFLGRNADEAGLEWYLDRLRDGLSLSEISDQIEDAAAHGAHRDGLDRVPFDGYRAILHQDELVATADQAPAVRALLNGELPMRSPVPVPIPVPPPASGGGMGGPSYRELIQELKAMRLELERATGYARKTADSTALTAHLNRRWEYAGIPETRN